MSAFCEHDVQSFTVARWTDFLPYNTDKKENKTFLIYKEIQMGSGAK
jgi:hypothetical protein